MKPWILSGCIGLAAALMVSGCTEANPAHLAGDATPGPTDAAVDTAAASDAFTITNDGTPAPDAAPPGDGPAVTVDAQPPLPDAAISKDAAPPDIGATCGNATREGDEQCDDGNLDNLDGCDSTCRFEQCHRINQLKMQFGTSPSCPDNAMGGAIVNSLLQTQLNSAIDTLIKDGTSNTLISFLDLDDLSGANDPALLLGVMGGLPWNTGPIITPASNLDGWYAFSWLDVDVERVPLNLVPATIVGGLLTAGPGKVTFAWGWPINGTTSLSDVTLEAKLSAVSKPLVATSVGGPGHLPAENLDPGLTSFAAAGSTSSTSSIGAGTLCGRVSAASLDLIDLDTSLLSYCSESYTGSGGASMLDVLINGCTVLMIQGIVPTQPDTDDPDIPPVGAGPPYTLSAQASNTNITSCRDKNFVMVPLQACLKDAAYSSFFTFTSGRVVIKCSGPGC